MCVIKVLNTRELSYGHLSTKKMLFGVHWRFECSFICKMYAIYMIYEITYYGIIFMKCYPEEGFFWLVEVKAQVSHVLGSPWQQSQFPGQSIVHVHHIVPEQLICHGQ